MTAQPDVPEGQGGKEYDPAHCAATSVVSATQASSPQGCAAMLDSAVTDLVATEHTSCGNMIEPMRVERTCELLHRGMEGFRVSGRSIHIKVDGRTYSGTFVVDRKVLTVTTTYGRKAAEISPRVAHEILAHQLLQDLVREEKARKGSTL